MTDRPVFRFAPSPNGRLHLGHARSAIYGFEMARRFGGKFLVRIEDIDITRARPEYVQGIFEDLEWLGLSWDTPVLIQSQHFAEYQAAAGRLDAMGLLYPCFATRTEIEAAADPKKIDPEGAAIYPGIWRGASASDVVSAKSRGEPFALRLDMEKAMSHAAQKLGERALTFRELSPDGGVCLVKAVPQRWGDVVILRKDVPASYLLSVVVDDARQGVTHVTRGMDLFAATDVQRLLQLLLDLPEPIYSHHALLMGADGRKLSKSHGDTSISELRRGGLSPTDIRRLAGIESQL